MAWVESVTNSLMHKYGAPILLYTYTELWENYRETALMYTFLAEKYKIQKNTV